jgi:RNA polymerase sigma-70 factor (ECF subfamily)
MLANAHDAEDVAQEALLKGFTRIEELRSGEQFRPWIARIARNLCVDLLRRRSTGREVHARWSERAEARCSDVDALEAALSRLPDEYRVPLILYYFDSESTESVANTLKISPAGVATRLSRARRQLRDLLNEEEGA